jgi:hypothetical protein
VVVDREGGREDKKSAGGSIAARPRATVAIAAPIDVKEEADSVEVSEWIDREGVD